MSDRDDGHGVHLHFGGGSELAPCRCGHRSAEHALAYPGACTIEGCDCVWFMQPVARREVSGCSECPNGDQLRYFANDDGIEYSRCIGVEVRGAYDGVLFWRCPDCGVEWHRWEDPDMRERAARYMTRQAEPWISPH